MKAILWAAGFFGPRPQALISGPQLLVPKKFSTGSTSSYLKSSHYDYGLWAYVLIKPCWLTHATCTCFKETALLLNGHLSYIVNFIMCLTDKYMFEVKKLDFGNCGSSIYCQNDQITKKLSTFWHLCLVQ